ncbi:MAG: tryptophan halogenase, partial [Lysobacter sp.]|nr:tryptophan halogenase [Lysobacter sp.]
FFRANGRVYRDGSELFADASWIEVMLGQGILPRGHHPIADGKPDARVLDMLADVKRVMRGVVELMPTHEDFIAQNCAAPAL